jgi:virginiamycin B lyase
LLLAALAASGTHTGAVARAAETTAVLPPAEVTGFAVPEAPPGRMSLGPEGQIWISLESWPMIDRLNTEGVPTATFPTPSLAGPFPMPFGNPEALPEISEPQDVATGADGNVWFTDTGRTSKGLNLIGRMTTTGAAHDYVVPQVESGALEYSAVNSIVAGPDGAMWFTGTQGIEFHHLGGTGFVGRISTGGHIEQFVVPTDSEPEVPSSSPREMIVGPGGNLWFADRQTNVDDQPLIGRVIPSTGAITEFPLTYNGTPLDSIALGADGNIWFTRGEATVGKMTPNGGITEFPVHPAGEPLGSLALGPDGDMWFGDGPAALGRIDPAGNVTRFTGAATGSESPSNLLAVGGQLWYRDGIAQVTRLIVPLTPRSAAPPQLVGRARVGEVMTLGGESWANSPEAVSHQWLLCDAAGGQCLPLSGATAPSLTIPPGAAGHRLAVASTATNVAGVAAAQSAPSAIVEAAPTPGQVVQGSTTQAAPLVGGALTWRFQVGLRFTRVASLVLRGVAAGASVEVRCQGRGCPFASVGVRRSGRVLLACRHGHCRRHRAAAGEYPLAWLLGGAGIRPGATLSVRAVRDGSVGKEFDFRIRRGASPRVRISCLAPGTSKPTGPC